MKLPLLLLCLSLPAAGRPLSELSMPEVVLPGTDGQPHPMRELLSHARLTVLTFFSSACDCQRAHDAILSDLAKTFGGRGVQFFLIDSEAGSSLQQDLSEAHTRHYPFAVLRDDKGQLSRAFEAQFATTTVILDANGRVHYRGGIDSSRKAPNPDTRPFLRQALEAISSGKEPAQAEPKALGCYLRGA